uniref:Uncharacterized protein n=1 Tax=Romanomermis culicivorax TaxID=13658 RepID=A0A915JYT1_ROMCU
RCGCDSGHSSRRCLRFSIGRAGLTNGGSRLTIGGSVTNSLTTTLRMGLAGVTRGRSPCSGGMRPVTTSCGLGVRGVAGGRNDRLTVNNLEGPKGVVELSSVPSGVERVPRLESNLALTLDDAVETETSDVASVDATLTVTGCDWLLLMMLEDAVETETSEVASVDATLTVTGCDWLLLMMLDDSDTLSLTKVDESECPGNLDFSDEKIQLRHVTKFRRKKILPLKVDEIVDPEDSSTGLLVTISVTSYSTTSTASCPKVTPYGDDILRFMPTNKDQTYQT